MKKLVLILCLTAFIACKTDKKEAATTATEDIADYKLLKGNYLYYNDVAILHTPTEVYGVVLNETAITLNNKVAPYKVLGTDMVPVEIKAEVTPKAEGEEGWPFKVKIVEILNITKPVLEKNDVITLGK
jgi:hypothetical protein